MLPRICRWPRSKRERVSVEETETEAESQIETEREGEKEIQRDRVTDRDIESVQQSAIQLGPFRASHLSATEKLICPHAGSCNDNP